MLLRRIDRRLRGALWAVYYAVTGFFRRIFFRIRLLRLGASEAYIREAFSYLAQLNIDEFYCAQSGTVKLFVRACGLQVHIIETAMEFSGDFTGVGASKHRLYEFVLFQDHNGQLVVHEWRDETRVEYQGWNEFGKSFTTHWWEVFRSGSKVMSLRFLPYIQQLYGDGVEVYGDDELRRL